MRLASRFGRGGGGGGVFTGIAVGEPGYCNEEVHVGNVLLASRGLHFCAFD